MPANQNHVPWERHSTVDGVWIGDSGLSGPTAVILGGVHGDESAGVELIERRHSLPIQRGRVIAILGNPAAVKTGQHWKDTNLNRAFRQWTDEEMKAKDLPYELVRARDIGDVILEARAKDPTFGLDDHMYSTEGSPTMAIAEEPGLALARQIGADILSYGWKDIEPGSTDAFFAEQGRPGVAYELGHLKDHDGSVILGHKVNRRFLSAIGVNDRRYNPLVAKPRVIQAVAGHVKKTDDFVFEPGIQPFDFVEPGQLIAVDGGEEVRAGKDGAVIMLPNTKYGKGSDAFVLGREVKT